MNHTVRNTTPLGFVSYTRGTFASEAAALRAADRRGPKAIVIAVPKSRMYDAYWVVGYVP